MEEDGQVQEQFYLRSEGMFAGEVLAKAGVPLTLPLGKHVQDSYMDARNFLCPLT